MKILACSDALYWDDFKKVANKEKPDFVFFLGDLVNDGHSLKVHINEFYRILKYASKIAKKVLVIKGNHDKEGYDRIKINKIKNCREVSGQKINLNKIKILCLGYGQCHHQKNLQNKLSAHQDINMIISHSEKRSWNHLLSSNAKIIINGHFKENLLHRTNNKIMLSLGCFPDYLVIQLDKEVKATYYEAEVKRDFKNGKHIAKTKKWTKKALINEELTDKQTDFEEINWENWFVLLNKKSNIKPDEISGKYLFFSQNKESLIKLAKELLIKYNLPQAKVPKNDAIGKDYVLCVYDIGPRFKQEMKQFADEVLIKYRYWKSNADTAAGKYSEKFKRQLTMGN